MTERRMAVLTEKKCSACGGELEWRDQKRAAEWIENHSQDDCFILNAKCKACGRGNNALITGALIVSDAPDHVELQVVQVLGPQRAVRFEYGPHRTTQTPHSTLRRRSGRGCPDDSTIRSAASGTAQAAGKDRGAARGDP
jgi:hypothetical protein